LILKKHLQAGGKSVADARKPSYNPDVFLKRIPNLKNLMLKEKEKSEDPLGLKAAGKQ